MHTPTCLACGGPNPEQRPVNSSPTTSSCCLGWDAFSKARHTAAEAGLDEATGREAARGKNLGAAEGGFAEGRCWQQEQGILITAGCAQAVAKLSMVQTRTGRVLSMNSTGCTLTEIAVHLLYPRV